MYQYSSVHDTSTYLYVLYMIFLYLLVQSRSVPSCTILHMFGKSGTDLYHLVQLYLCGLDISGTGTKVTNSRLCGRRRHAPDDDIEFIFFASH
jgi:hypothetical protein